LTGEGEMLRADHCVAEARELIAVGGKPGQGKSRTVALILAALKDFDEEKARDLLRYIEKEKLLMDLFEERKGRGEAG